MTGLDTPAVGDLAAEHALAVHALIPRPASLEDAYLDLTGETDDLRAVNPQFPRFFEGPNFPEGPNTIEELHDPIEQPAQPQKEPPGLP